VKNRDRITPGGGSGSLDGDHVFQRFNPAAGVVFDVSRATNLYAGCNEGSRAATSIEPGCADPESPCKLPNERREQQLERRDAAEGAPGLEGSIEIEPGDRLPFIPRRMFAAASRRRRSCRSSRR
jgi:hypothetical protein